jgi:tetratricopeptide (TPR) repeat protein
MSMMNGDMPVGFDGWWILSGLLLIPYLVCGVWLLRLRFRDRIDIGRRYEALTAGALLLFFAFEVGILKAWLSPRPAQLILAAIGLFSSAIALYGHVAISLASRLVVDIVMPGPLDHSNEPQYGAAEGFEQQGDYQEAANEYRALARMFPKESKATLRVADNLMKLRQFDEAAEWFERGLALLSTPEQSLPITNRLFEIYHRALERPEEARAVLDNFLKRFPNSEYAGSVRKRLHRLDETVADRPVEAFVPPEPASSQEPPDEDPGLE